MALDHKKIERERYVERYVDDELSREEKRNFEEHYFNCPACAQDVLRMQDIVEGIKRSAAKRAPAKVSQRPVKRFSTAQRWFAAGLGAMALLVAVFIIKHEVEKQRAFFPVQSDQISADLEAYADAEAIRDIDQGSLSLSDTTILPLNVARVLMKAALQDLSYGIGTSFLGMMKVTDEAAVGRSLRYFQIVSKRSSDPHIRQLSQHYITRIEKNLP